jgi:hypothetical protein
MKHLHASHTWVTALGSAQETAGGLLETAGCIHIHTGTPFPSSLFITTGDNTGLPTGHHHMDHPTTYKPL